MRQATMIRESTELEEFWLSTLDFAAISRQGLAVLNSELAGSITSDKITSLNAGVINAGIVTAICYQTASSGQAVRIHGAGALHKLQVISAVPDLRVELSVDGVFAKDLGGWSTSSPCTLRYTHGRFSYSGSTVYGPAAKNTTWANLNLSSIVGARRALVLLRVYNTSGVNKNYQFRIDGTGIEQGEHAEDFPGAFSCRCTTAKPYNYVWVMTGTNGYVEWRTTVTGTTTVVLLAYIS